MAVTVNDIKTLRESTGAGIMECKEALEQSNGDQNKASDILREKGFAQAAKRSDRDTTQGVIAVSYTHLTLPTKRIV